LLLSLTALLLGFDAFTAWTQTIAWMVVFFFASAAASSAYLTVSEIFPLEARALVDKTYVARNVTQIGPNHEGGESGAAVCLNVAPVERSQSSRMTRTSSLPRSANKGHDRPACSGPDLREIQINRCMPLASARGG
jgi:hypothetical protein